MYGIQVAKEKGGAFFYPPEVVQVFSSLEEADTIACGLLRTYPIVRILREIATYYVNREESVDVIDAQSQRETHTT